MLVPRKPSLLLAGAVLALAPLSLATVSTLAAPVGAPVGATLSEEDEVFPLRKDYPDLQYMSTEQVNAILSVAILVDARNSVEFDVIHIDGAVNIPAKKMTAEDLLALRAKDAKRPMIFYCNGHTCTKSYKACRKAADFGFENVFVYDAGVLSFATVRPDKTWFFGKPMDAKTVSQKLISKETFKAQCLSPADFLGKMESGDYTVFDLRDSDERAKIVVELPNVVGGSIDEFVGWLEEEGRVPGSKLLLMDWVGKQVKWAHYYLIESGRTDFYFLDGGIEAWMEAGDAPVTEIEG